MQSAITFYSHAAEEFHASYQADANRQERVQIWHGFFDRYARTARFAYDIGCGSGIFACELARRGIETIGIDGAAPMLAIAQESARTQNLTRLSFQQARLPMDTNAMRQADLVISSSVIEYLDSLPEALQFLHSLLKDNGTLIFSISNRDSISRKLIRFIHRITGLPRYLALVRHFVTMEEMEALLSHSGFLCIEQDYCGRADPLNRFLSYFLPARFSSNMLIIAARKKS